MDREADRGMIQIKTQKTFKDKNSAKEYVYLASRMSGATESLFCGLHRAVVVECQINNVQISGGKYIVLATWTINLLE